jgi:hypothetical protein
MAPSYSTPHPPTPRRLGVAQVIVMGGVGLGVAALLGTLLLWFHYGRAVFYQTIAAGFSACF